MRDKKTSVFMCVRVLIGVVIALFSASTSTAQCIDYDDYMHWVGTVETPGTISKMVVSGSYSYAVDSEAGLQIFDLTQPESPVLVGTLDTPSVSKAIAVSGQYVYFGPHSPGLYDFLIIDVEDPEIPTIVATLVLQDIPNGIAISGPHAFVATNDDAGLQVINISDPHSPEVVAQVNTGGSFLAVTVVDNLAFVLNSIFGLQIFDISDHLSPQLIGSLNSGHNFLAMVVAENHLYVTTYDTLRVVDITNPEDPQVIASQVFPRDDYINDSLGDLVLNDNLLFVGTRFGGLEVVDISNPTELSIVGGFSMQDGNKRIATHENHAYIGGSFSEGFEVVDISNPLSPEMVGMSNGWNDPEEMVVAGDYLCVAASYSGFEVVDISDPQDPQIIGGVSTPEEAISVGVSGTHAYVGEIEGKLRIIDFSDPTTPEIVAYRSLSGEIREVIVQDDLVFLTREDGDMHALIIYNITNPENPVYQGGLFLPPLFGSGMCMDVEGDIVCVGQDARLYVIDISNPSSPFLAGTLNDWGGFYDVVISGTHANVIAGYGQFLVVDISNPENPVVEASTDLLNGGGELSISGNAAYVMTRGFGVQVLDITNALNPRFIGSFPRPIDYGCLASTEDYIFATGWDRMLAVFPAQCSPVSSIPAIAIEASVPLLETNYPNPFNPQTSIGYWLPEESLVSLDIYDLAGRFIRSIVQDEVNRSGSHSVVWDGRDASGLPTPSGVYFYRLEAGDYSETRRMVLIK